MTEDYATIDEALEDTYNLSVEEYQSYEGMHGVMSWEDCREDLEESGFDYDDESVDSPIKRNSKVGSLTMSNPQKMNK